MSRRAALCSTLFVRPSSADPHEHLVQHHVVHDLAALELVQAGGEPLCQPAAAVNEVGDARAAERSQRRPGRESPCPAGTTPV
jgi:hypothetical protein